MKKSALVCILGLLIAGPATSTKATEQDDAAMEAVIAKCPGAAKVILEGHPNMASFEAAKRAEATVQRAPLPAPQYPELRESLLEMGREDQAVRSSNPDFQDRKVVEKFLATDASNLARLKKIVAEHGFPTPPMVGQDGFNAAWLLVQHADPDPAFQQAMLEQMVEKRLLGGEHLALLTDRVLRAQGKPQRYGSQFTPEDGRQVPEPIEEPLDKLDERRASMGMMPFDDYRCSIEVMYPAQKK